MQSKYLSYFVALVASFFPCEGICDLEDVPLKPTEKAKILRIGDGGIGIRRIEMISTEHISSR